MRRRKQTTPRRRITTISAETEKTSGSTGQSIPPQLLPNRTPFGILSRFPHEILLHIFSATNLSIPALASLRRVSRAFKALVDASIPYTELKANHPMVIRAFINSGATFPTCATVCAGLTLDRCHQCNCKFSDRSPDPRSNRQLSDCVAYLYLLTGHMLCLACWNPVRHHDTINVGARDFRPWSERHLKHHLHEKRKEVRKEGGAAGMWEWKRVKVVPSAWGLQRLSRESGKVSKGWIRGGRQRTRVYDPQMVESMFKLGLARGTLFLLDDVLEACGCSGGNVSADDRQAIDHVVLPFVRERKGGPLVAFTQFHWDIQPKARFYSNTMPLFSSESPDSSREGSPGVEGEHRNSEV